MAAVANAVLNIISGSFGAVGLAAFAAEFVPKPDLKITSVSIAVGQATTDPKNHDPDELSGNIPAVKVFSEFGVLVASEPGDVKGKWPAGSKNTMHLKDLDGAENVAGQYVAVYATGKNAICISAVGLRNPNEDKSWGWLADVGETCGMQFHWSETEVGTASTANSYKPNCVWISAPDSNNPIKTSGFSMKLNDFSQVSPARARAYNDNPDIMCNAPPRFSAYTFILPQHSPPIYLPHLNYTDDTDALDMDVLAVLGVGVDITDYGHVPLRGLDPIPSVRLPYFAPIPGVTKKRSLPLTKRSPVFDSTLISSAHESHSAKYLCEAENSYGPDVISTVEGLFCDMDDKVLWPLCKSESEKACFDTEVNALRGGSVRRGEVPVKEYTDVKMWGIS